MSKELGERKAPSIDWSYFPEGELPTKAIGTPILCIALDTEYQSNYTANTNLCLSYQFAAYDLLTGAYKKGIFYMNVAEEQRLILSEFTHRVLKEMGISPSFLKDNLIVFIAHFFTAEWAMFRDRLELYMKFEFIRKTLITTKPLKTTIIGENGETIDLWVEFRDTMLLLPDSFKSLDKASSFIKGYEKIDLSTEIKSNMYQFLQDEPVKFEEYAIRDAEVTLKLFIKLQYHLNKINETDSELYTTLSNATTNSFKRFSRNKFLEMSEGENNTPSKIHNMQFDRFHTLYKKYESLGDRSYMGGLNSSYHIGYCEGYTFIDIDFKNAYPTAMNLLKIADFGEKIERKKKKEREEELKIILQELTYG